MVTDTKGNANLDQEWISLMRAAKRMKLTPNDIRHFIQQVTKQREKKE